jgi:hypothetical protein
MSDVDDLAFDIAFALSQKSIGEVKSWSAPCPRRQLISAGAPSPSICWIRAGVENRRGGARPLIVGSSDVLELAATLSGLAGEDDTIADGAALMPTDAATSLRGSA